MAYKSTSKTEAHRLKTRQRILDEATKLVYSGGFKAISMSEVATNANIATGSIYRHFPSRADLCAELFRIYTELEVSNMNEIAKLDIPIHEKLTMSVEVFARRAIKGRNLAWALIAEPLDPLLENERLHYRKAYADIFSKSIKSGIKEGTLVKQDANISAAALVGALAETLVGPLSPANHKTLDEREKKKLIKSMSLFCQRALGFLGD